MLSWSELHWADTDSRTHPQVDIQTSFIYLQVLSVKENDKDSAVKGFVSSLLNLIL